jgi:preprotein translocase SecE subunit
VKTVDLEDEGKPTTSQPEDESGSRVSAKLPKIPFVGRIADFYHGVKMELRKTSWPNRTEVTSTTVVVLVAVFFFGFYLWGVDRLVTIGFRWVDAVLGR